MGIFSATAFVRKEGREMMMALISRFQRCVNPHACRLSLGLVVVLGFAQVVELTTTRNRHWPQEQLVIV